MFDWATHKRESSSFYLNLVITWGGNVMWRLGKVRGHHVKGRCRREDTYFSFNTGFKIRNRIYWHLWHCGTVKKQERSDLLKVIEVLRKAVDLAPKKICNLNRMHEHQHKYQHIWKNRRNRSLTIIKPRKKCDTFGFLWEQRGGNRLTFCVYSFVCLVVLQFIKHWCIWGGTLPVNYPININ